MLEAMSVSGEERALFMMAESMFRYRFDAPKPHFKAYLVQTAAVITELPAFQELSAALDIGSLRMKTYDGAVQLWESLLAADPESPLRSLALYRLGWAYRNVSVSGLPSSSAKAFAELAGTDGAELGLLARAAREVPWKSRDAATAYSLFPGLPQLYLGQYGVAALRLGVGLGALAAVVIPTVMAIERGSGLSLKHDWPLLLTGTLGLLVLTVNYTGSYQDAVHDVVEYNEHQEERFEREHPSAP